VSFAIPPNEGNYRAPRWISQSSRIYPDGRDEVVLSVPRYDFNWQLAYDESVKLPKGSRLHFEFRYDNSANNKNNPDPSRWVYQGFQSWEEMMVPNLGFLLDRDADVASLMSVSK
jgi:hypothetical protein